MRGAISDIYLGFSEHVVRWKLGKPVQVVEGPVSEMMNKVLQDRYSENPNTVIRQLKYERFKTRADIWFAENSQGEWIVVSDITYSGDMQF